MGCERVNVWLFGDGESSLRCIDLYEATPDRHSAATFRAVTWSEQVDGGPWHDIAMFC